MSTPEVTQQRKIGLIVDGTDHFLKPIEANLRRHHRVERFAPRFVRLPLIGQRVNQTLLDWQLQRFIRDNDVTFFEWAASLLVQATHLPKRGKLVARLHSVELATAAEQIDWSQVDHLIVLTETILRRLEGLTSQPLPPVSIVPNGVALDRYSPRPQQFQHRLGMVCSLLPIKRIYEVILALHQLRQEGYLFTLDVAGAPGKGDARRYLWALESLVTKLHLEEAVTFHNYVANIAEWLGNIDIFISNSYWEGQQIALLEAMASGCYCVSHCWDGVETILPPENLFITDVQLRQKILTYVGLPEQEKVSKQLRLRQIAQENFDEQRMIRDITAVVERVAKA